MINYSDLSSVKYELDQKIYHIFGGSDWNIISGGYLDKPVLIITIDCRDTNLKFLNIENFKQHYLPICSYLNSNAWCKEQEFYIDFINKKIIDKTVLRDIEPYPEEDKLPYILEEKKLWSSSIKKANVDDFLDSMFGKEPFKISQGCVEDSLKNLLCKSCNKPIKNIGYIGYENFNSRNFIKNSAFFYGEGGLHVSFCVNCSILKLNPII